MKKYFFNFEKKHLWIYIVIFIISFAGFSINFAGFSQTNFAKEATIAHFLSDNSKNNSTTYSISISLTSTNNDMTKEQIYECVDSIRNYTIQYTSRDNSSGRVGFNISNSADKMTFKILDSDYLKFPAVFLANTHSLIKKVDNKLYHEVPNLEVMFGTGIYNTSTDGSDNICFITQSRADKLMEELHLDDYEELIGYKINVETFSGDQITWKIANIFVPNSSTNYEQLISTFDDFIYIATTSNDYFDYFSVSYDFGISVPANLRYLKDVLNIIDFNYDCHIMTNNLLDINDVKLNEISSLITEYYEFRNNLFDKTSVITVSISSLLLLSILIIYFIKHTTFIHIFSVTLGFVFSYILFWLIANSNRSNFIYLLDEAVQINLILFCIFLLITIIVYYLFVKKYRNRVIFIGGVHETIKI